MKMASILLCAVAAYAAPQQHTLLQVTSVPQGATVFVDHANRGVTPLSLADVAPGRHLVQIAMEGRKEAFRTVSAKEGELTLVSLELEREAGLLLLQSDPPGATVSENGVAIGTTPLLESSLPCGRHKLRLTSPGYRQTDVEVSLDGRTPVRRSVSMQATSGALDVESDPAGATVFVNGIERGIAPCEVDRIAGGVALVELKLAGYELYKREVSLEAGEKQTLHAALTASPGTLSIVSIPEGARVYVDDEYKGKTPLALAKTAPGSYRVRVESDGHEPMARDITLANGASMVEEFRLAENTGRLEIRTEPAAAMIVIDGKKRGLSTGPAETFALGGVKEGAHELRVEKKGYHPSTRTIEITRGKTLSISVKLNKMFIPDYEVTTTRGKHRGVFVSSGADGVRIETAPGVVQTFPLHEIKQHAPIPAEL